MMKNHDKKVEVRWYGIFWWKYWLCECGQRNYYKKSDEKKLPDQKPWGKGHHMFCSNCGGENIYYMSPIVKY